MLNKSEEGMERRRENCNSHRSRTSAMKQCSIKDREAALMPSRNCACLNKPCMVTAPIGIVERRNTKRPHP